MNHDNHVLAADEPDHDHHRPAGVASVHTRALVTWVAIFPLATLGMYALASWAPGWPVPVRALALTAVVVPVTVYLTVPRLLLVVLAVSDRARGRRRRRSAEGADAREAAMSLPTTGARR